MDDNKVSVTLASPAKIDGKREPAGKVVVVSATVAGHLHAAQAVGSAPLIFDTSDTQTSAEFDDAVELAARGMAEKLVGGAVATALAQVKSERDELTARLATATELLAETKEQLFEAEAHLENAAFDKAVAEAAGAKELDELRKRVPELEAALAEATKAGAAKTTKK